MGGVLKVATIGEPPTLDIPMSTATISYEIMWHVNETLFTYDAGFNPVPLLADTHTVTDGGRRHTITLRKGVKFHNGKEMTSADVVPSLKRWGQVASLGKSLWANVESIDAKDAYTVVLSPEAALGLAAVRPGRAARRRSIPRKSSRPPATGRSRSTPAPGPYRFVEHKPDRHLKLGALQGLRRAQRAGQRLRRQAGRVLRRDPVHPGAGYLGPAGRRGDRRVPPRDVREAGLLRPDQVPAPARVAHRQAARLGGGGAEPQGRRHDGQEGAAGVPGRARHGADHDRRLRQQDLLPARPRPVLPRAALALDGRAPSSTTSTTPRRPSAC